jgi:hypothetical protein
MLSAVEDEVYEEHTRLHVGCGIRIHFIIAIREGIVGVRRRRGGESHSSRGIRRRGACRRNLQWVL